MSAFAISSILDKMNKADKDFRYMATNDLQAQFEKDEEFKIDRESERKLVAALLKQVDDTNTEVQNLTVGCLGLLVTRVHDESVETVVNQLADNVLSSSKEELRDLSSLGLTNILAAISPSSPQAVIVCSRLTPRMVEGLGSDDVEVVARCLQVLSAILQSFGALVARDLKSVLDALLPCLAHSRAAIRKGTVQCISLVAVTADEALFSDLVAFLLNVLKSDASARANIQAVGAIARSVGHRLGRHLDDLVPLILRTCGSPEDTDMDDEGDSYDVIECCLQTLEAFVRRCPSEVAPHLDSIIETSLGFVSFDPNYVDDDSEEEDDDDEEDDSEFDDYDDEVSDDEDSSWKVRKAAAKCLCAIIVTRADMLESMYARVAPALISRFREREETVKTDIFATFVELLRTTAAVTGNVDRADSAVAQPLVERVPDIVTGVAKQLSTKSVRTRQAGFTLLQELVDVLPGALEPQFGVIMPSVLAALVDRSSDNNLRMKVLRFLRSLISTHEPTAFQPFVADSVEPVIALVSDGYYKTSADALRVLGEIVCVLRVGDFDFANYVTPLYKAVEDRLQAQDSDQEVKQCAIRSMGFLISLVGDCLGDQLSTALPLLLEKLRNEITCNAAVRAFGEIAASKLCIDLSAYLADTTAELATFLRKSSRSLKQHSLLTLTAIVRAYGANMDEGLYPPFLTETASLVSDGDLHLAHLSTGLAATCLEVKSSGLVVGSIKGEILPAALELVQSSLLQGAALEGVIGLLTALVSGGVTSFNELVDSLFEPVKAAREVSDLPKQAYSSTAQCVASLCVAAAGADERDAAVAGFIDNVRSEGTPEPVRLVSLMTVGEVGHRLDLEHLTDVQDVVLAAFDVASEDIKSAASFALGNIAVGNLGRFVPFLLEEIRTRPKRQYLLLHSLKETISRVSAAAGALEALGAYISDIWTLLLEHCENVEEGTRNVVAECLGKLALVDPTNLISSLRETAESESAFTRGTLVAAVKFTISSKPNPAVDSLLAEHMPSFLSHIGDGDLFVRRGALKTLNFAAHNKPALIRDSLADVLPLVYAETPFKEELCKKIKIGPFTRVVDEGLENRKAAYELMYTLLETALDRIETHEFIGHVIGGLTDKEYDIKMLALLILQRLASVAGQAVLEALDAMVDNLRAIVTKKLKDKAAESDKAQNEELIRVAMRAIYMLSEIPNASSCMQWDDFVRNDLMAGELGEKYAAVVDELTNILPDDRTMDTS